MISAQEQRQRTCPSGRVRADVSELTCHRLGFLFILQQDYSGILTKRFRGILEDNLKNVGIISRNWKQTGRCSPALWEHQDVLWGFILWRVDVFWFWWSSSFVLLIICEEISGIASFVEICKGTSSRFDPDHWDPSSDSCYWYSAELSELQLWLDCVLWAGVARCSVLRHLQLVPACKVIQSF